MKPIFYSPTASMTSFSIDEHTSAVNNAQNIQNLNSTESTSHNVTNTTQQISQQPPPPSQQQPIQADNSLNSSTNNALNNSNNNDGNETETSDSNTHKDSSNKESRDDLKERLKAEKKAAKKLAKEMAICKIILEEMEVCIHSRLMSLSLISFSHVSLFFQVHEDSWPFLLPVNTKQFPTYKKIIKHPMDLSTIKKRLQDTT
jgi:hypothetical protein